MMHPDEVLKGLDECSGETPMTVCRLCPYYNLSKEICETTLLRDAAKLIRDLQAAEITNEKIIGQLEREIEDLKQQLAWRDEPDDYGDWRD